MDILIFAVIAAFLVYRLNAVLGTRNDSDRPRPNPFAAPEPREDRPPLTVVSSAAPARLPAAIPLSYIDAEANKDGRIAEGLEEIAGADSLFDVAHFVTGAKMAFETVVNAYARGDRTLLKPLLSPKLYGDFDAAITAREAAGHVSATDIRGIKAVRIVAARLAGAMAYITVDFDVEQTSVTRDGAGAVVEGNPEAVTEVDDIWTFTRDVRSTDPNWIIIETKTADHHASA